MEAPRMTTKEELKEMSWVELESQLHIDGLSGAQRSLTNEMKRRFDVLAAAELHICLGDVLCSDHKEQTENKQLEDMLGCCLLCEIELLEHALKIERNRK